MARNKNPAQGTKINNDTEVAVDRALSAGVAALASHFNDLARIALLASEKGNAEARAWLVKVGCMLPGMPIMELMKEGLTVLEAEQDRRRG